MLRSSIQYSVSKRAVAHQIFFQSFRYNIHKPTKGHLESFGKVENIAKANSTLGEFPPRKVGTVHPAIIRLI
jgi:hypothetical protein